MISIETYKIISNHFVKKLDFDKIYNMSAKVSKSKFGRKIIINGIKKTNIRISSF